MIQSIRVLIADEDAEQAHALGKSLVRQGYFCELARSCSAALDLLERVACDVVLCDAKLGGGQLELLDRLQLKEAAPPVIILTSSGTTEQAVQAIKHGAYDYLARGCSIDDLGRHIRLAVASAPMAARASLITELRPARDITQQSSAMQELMSNVDLVARSSAPVLLLGETGSGKELIARAIHARGPRARFPFVAVNTTALPEHLLESELFGHVKGAYTGATQARGGLFAEADGGTLLLDEIGDMPKVLQPKILRLLQFGELRAVGGDRPRRVDVRIIAATHRDLSALIEQGLFRDDLRYRLNTLALRVPPLRERRADILPLAHQFLEEARRRTPGSPVHSIDADAARMLEQADWPGNVRELEGAMERLVVLGRDAVITPAALQFLGQGYAAPVNVQPDDWMQTGSTPFTLRQMNQRYLDWVLERTEGDKVRAAEVLGIDISTLYRWQRSKN